MTIFKSTYKVVIVDDHHILRKSLRFYLEQRSDLMVVGECGNQAELQKLVKDHTPDIILMDIHLQNSDGIHLTETILQQYPDQKILFLSNEKDHNFIVRAMQSGGKGYVSKDAFMEELILAIKSIVKGGTYLSGAISSEVLKKINSNSPYQKRNEGPNLTRREIEILECVYQELTNEETAQNLFISPRTVDTHKRNLMKKLSVKNSVGLVKYYIEQLLSREAQHN